MENIEKEEKLLLTIDEMASLSGLGKNTAYKLAKRDDFPCVIIGNKKMAIKSQLDNWFIKHIGESI